MAIMRRAHHSATEEVVPGSAAPGRSVTASTVVSNPRPQFAFWGVTLSCVGAIGGWFLFQWWDPAPFRPSSDYSIFAGLFVVAAAVERLLEPFTAYVKPDTTQTKKELEQAVASAHATADPGKPEDAANKQEQLDRERSERAFILWGIATLVSTLLCAGLGLLLLRSVTLQPLQDPNRFLDLAITGLVVGAGTKPLHDLVSRLEKAKEKDADPPETNG